MEIELLVKKKFNAKYLQVDAGVRYWEDAVVNGSEDESGELMPCIEDGRWKPIIDIETGIIINWEKGKTADVHYKVCDDGVYKLLDENKEKIVEIDGYVPSFMSPKESGYGDYIIMDIDQNGKIIDFEFNIVEFEIAED